MEEKDVIQILRQYRHDLLNHLQIVQGYSSMGKTDKVQTKIVDYMQSLNEERKLMNLNAPLFALYLIQFNSLHTNFRLTYHIHTDSKKVQLIDETLVERCKQIIGQLENVTNDSELYEVTIQMNEIASESVIELIITVKGNFHGVTVGKNIENMDKDINVSWDIDGISCSLTIPC